MEFLINSHLLYLRDLSQIFESSL